MPQLTRLLPRFGAMFAPLLVLLVACVPTTEHPVIVPGQDVYDPALMGLWYGTLEEDDETVLMQISLADEDDHDYPGGMRFLMSGYAETPEETGWSVLYGLSAEVNGETFLSLDFQTDQGEIVEGDIRRYHLYHYAITDNDHMVLRAVDEDKLEELIEAGELQGTINKGRYTSDIRITDSSANLVAFLAREPLDRLFSDEPGMFTRQKPRM